jgi:hypothetical protein
VLHLREATPADIPALSRLFLDRLGDAQMDAGRPLMDGSTRTLMIDRKGGRSARCGSLATAIAAGYTDLWLRRSGADAVPFARRSSVPAANCSMPVRTSRTRGGDGQ